MNVSFLTFSFSFICVCDGNNKAFIFTINDYHFIIK